MAIGKIERAARAELRNYPQELKRGTLAAIMLDLAHRIDLDPGDRSACILAREIRMTSEALMLRAPSVSTEAAEYLKRIANSRFGHD